MWEATFAAPCCANARIMEASERSLEEMDKLSLQEFDLLKENIDNFIDHLQGASVGSPQ